MQGHQPWSMARVLICTQGEANPQSMSISASRKTRRRHLGGATKFASNFSLGMTRLEKTVRIRKLLLMKTWRWSSMNKWCSRQVTMLLKRPYPSGRWTWWRWKSSEWCAEVRLSLKAFRRKPSLINSKAEYNCLKTSIYRDSTKQQPTEGNIEPAQIKKE